MTKHTSESQTSWVELLPLTACAGTGRNGCADSISSAHVQAVVPIKTKMSPGDRKRTYLGLQNGTIESLNTSELPIPVVFRGHSRFRFEMLIHQPFFWGVQQGSSRVCYHKVRYRIRTGPTATRSMTNKPNRAIVLNSAEQNNQTEEMPREENK